MRGNKSQNKLVPNAKDTNTLLQELESYTPEGEEEVILEEDYKNDSLAFISTYNILQGKEPVNVVVLYYLYSQWTKTKLTRAQFDRELGKYFPWEIKKRKKYFYINQNALEITKAGYSLAKKSTKDITKNPSRKKHFEAFLKSLDIKPGEFYIEGWLLYRVYDKWAYENKSTNPIGETNFFKLLHLYFKCKSFSYNDPRFFGVDEKSFFKHTSSRMLNRIRKAKKEKIIKEDRYGHKKEGKKRKKRANSLSSLKPWSKSKD